MSRSENYLHWYNKIFCFGSKKDVKLPVKTFIPREEKVSVKDLIKKFDKPPVKSFEKRDVITKPKESKLILPNKQALYNKMLVVNSLTTVLKNKSSDTCLKVSEIIRYDCVNKTDLSKGIKYISMQCCDLGFLIDKSNFN